jgi:1,2-diacylglycerol 3-alpha-glucosyltransferase
MVITFVMDTFGDLNNGTTCTCMRTARVLLSHGHEVRVIAYIPAAAKAKDLEGYKILRCRKVTVPVFDNLITKEGMTFADADEKDIAEFIKGSDIVHCYLPFLIERKARRVARVMGIPVTSAMHMQPENVSYALHLGKCTLVNNIIYKLIYNWMYRYTRHVHTPSEMMKDQMIKHHYPNAIHAISNGVASAFVPKTTEKPDSLKDKYVILMIGRYAGEKRQDLIIKAIGKSKYNDRIQLILAGQGPLEKKLRKLSRKYLKNPCIFGFHAQEDLIPIIRYSDLYIHASDAETEAISCIEAFSCGKVPIISDSPLSATNHFALDSRCLFKAGNSDSLRDRIDYFIQHPEVKATLEGQYADYGKTFAIDNCVMLLEEMFKDEIEDERKDVQEGKVFNTSRKERRRLKKTAKKIGLAHPIIM